MVQSNEKGAALTEFSLSLLILLPLLFGGFEIGRAIIGYQELILTTKELTKVAVRTVGDTASDSVCVYDVDNVSRTMVSAASECVGHEDVQKRAEKLVRTSPWVKTFTKSDFQVTTKKAANVFSVEITVTPSFGILSLVNKIRVVEQGVLI